MFVTVRKRRLQFEIQIRALYSWRLFKFDQLLDVTRGALWQNILSNLFLLQCDKIMHQSIGLEMLYDISFGSNSILPIIEPLGIFETHSFRIDPIFWVGWGS